MPDIGWKDLCTDTQDDLVALQESNVSEIAIWDCSAVGQNGDCFGKIRLDRLQKAACVMITEAMRTTPIQVQKVLLDLPQLDTVIEATTAYSSVSPSKIKLKGPKNRARPDLIQGRVSGQ